MTGQDLFDLHRGNNAERLAAELAERATAIDALEAGTTSSVVTIHPVRGASTGNIANLAAFTVANDGITLVAGDRFLAKDQSTATQNGIYVVGTVAGGTAPLTRAADFDAATEVKPNAIVAVSAGTLGANTLWQLTVAAAPTIGGTNLPFVQLLNATQATAAGITIAKRTVTVAEAELSGASQEVNVGAILPTNAIVLGHEIVTNTQGVLAGNDLTIKLGGTVKDAIVAATDLDTLAPGKYQGTLGTHPRGSFSGEQLVATFAASDLATLSAGNWTITVWYSALA